MWSVRWIPTIDGVKYSSLLLVGYKFKFYEIR